MMNRPEDDMFQELLGDYMAPAADNGFTALVMEQAEQQARREKRYRRIAINGAALIGGIMAGVQLPKLGQLISNLGYTAPRPDIRAMDVSAFTSALPQNMMLLIGALVIGLAIWATLDQRGSELL